MNRRTLLATLAAAAGMLRGRRAAAATPSAIDDVRAALQALPPDALPRFVPQTRWLTDGPVPLLWNHDRQRRLGRAAVYEDGRVMMELVPDTFPVCGMSPGELGERLASDDLVLDPGYVVLEYTTTELLKVRVLEVSVCPAIYPSDEERRIIFGTGVGYPRGVVQVGR